ncbi:MAG: hypothetical protein ABJE47_05800 [bacterium]
MTDFTSAVINRPLPQSLEALALGSMPAAYTRLEPQSISGDPTPGLEARVHDPLWMIARQWQLGEFHAEDVGTPVSVQVLSTSNRASAWQPGDPSANRTARALAQDHILDPLVEREPSPLEGPGLRQRAEAGSQLIDDLLDASIGGVADALVAACPLLLTGDPDPFDAQGPRLQALLSGRVPDAEQAALDLEAAGGAAPAWLGGAGDVAGALAVATEWLAWYRGSVAPLRDPDADSWIDERLEYRFSVRVDRADGDVTLRAPSFEGGRVDWHVFDRDDDPNHPVVTPDVPRDVSNEEREVSLVASPLRFAGMPSDRYWQFENGAVNLGMLETQPHDLARLCLAEFAMIYGNDWLVVPLDVDAASMTQVRTVSYTNTFGERIRVDPPADADRTGRFRMYRITTPDGVGEVDGLFTPPTMPSVHEGRALEDVLFLRDEVAAMGWAVERVIQGPSGDARNRGDEPRPVPPVPRSDAGAELDYVLETEVPDHWIPLVPVSVGVGAVALRKGAMLKDGAPVLARGLILRPTPLTLRDEELAREGVRVRRVPALARRADGSFERWIGRRVSVGRGEGVSGLGFDWAIPRVNGG